MADAGLFLRWGPPIRGRERKGFEFFAETLEYYRGLQENRRIESFETVLLDAHGGDMRGFVLLRGERRELAALRVEDEFVRTVLRAGLILEGVGVISAHLSDGIGRYLGLFQSQVEELA